MVRSNHNESKFNIHFLIVYMDVKGVTGGQILENPWCRLSSYFSYLNIPYQYIIFIKLAGIHIAELIQKIFSGFFPLY